MILQVKIGENLNYTVGRLRYSSDAGTNPTASDTSELTTTIIVILSVIAVVMAFIIIVLVIIIICVVIRKSKKKQSVAFTGNNDVNMYASPAYGAHQVFTEPGLDHLYEPIHGLHEEKTTKLQDTASPTNDNNEIDGEDYLKMKPSCEVVDQAITESSVVFDTCSTFVGSKSTDEYVQALGNDVYVSSIKSDDGRDDGDKDNKSADKKDDGKDDGKDNEGDDKDNSEKDNKSIDKDDGKDDGKDNEGDDEVDDHDEDGDVKVNEDNKGGDKDDNDQNTMDAKN